MRVDNHTPGGCFHSFNDELKPEMCLALDKIRKTGALKENPVRSFIAAVSVGVIGGVIDGALGINEDLSYLS